MRKKDWAAINRVMSRREMFSGLHAGGPGQRRFLTTAEDLAQLKKIEQKLASVKVSLKSTEKFGDVTTEQGLQAALEKVREDLMAGHQGDAQRGEAFVEFARTTQGLLERFEATNVEQAAKLAEMTTVANEANDIAKRFARNGGADNDGSWNLNQSAIRALPWSSYQQDSTIKSGQKIDPVQFGMLAMPDYEMKRLLPEKEYKAIRLWREYGDMIAILNACELARGGQKTQNYLRQGGWESLRFAEPYKELSKVLQATGALSTGASGDGSDWIPTGWTSTLFEDIRAIMQVVAQFQQIPMPTTPYIVPVLGASATAYLHAEQTGTSPTTSATVSNVESVNLTLTAVMHTVFTAISLQFDQDTIVPALPLFRRDVAYAHQFGLEDAYVSSQLAATIDTPAPTGTNVQLSFQYGIRSAANAIATGQVDQAGTPTVDTLVPIMAKMGKYARPSDCFWATGYHGFARILLLKDSAGNPLLLTQEKVGVAAAIQTGTVGVLLGSPLVVSDPWPNTMDADGLVAGTSIANTSMALVNRRMFVGGTRMAMEVDASNDYLFGSNQIALRSNLRPALSTLRTPSDTYPFVGLAKNIACFT